MKKTISILVVAALVALLGWRVAVKIMEAGGPAKGRPARAVPVEAVPVARRTMTDVARFTGTLYPRSRFVVAPKVSGRLEKLFVNIGDTVKNGQLLAELDNAEYVQQVAQATAELQVARANLADSKSGIAAATREYERAKELRRQKVASEAELDEAEALYNAAMAKVDVATAQIKQKEAELAAAEVRLSYARINASWEDGGSERRVAERFVDQGAMLKANDPIVSIVDTSSVLAVIFVIERDYPDILPGQEAEVTTDAHGDRTFRGRVARRAPVLQEESRQARVEIEIENPDGLLAPGMFVRANIRMEARENAAAVPVSALARRNGSQGVFLVDPETKKARFVPVKTGISQDGMVEILSPEISGLVITLGHHLVEDGTLVALSGDKPDAGERRP
ncbi:MAG: efflux RND transporter periplasmic adaptor subunit [Thermodesulfobacteriota bacterium]